MKIKLVLFLLRLSEGLLVTCKPAHQLNRNIANIERMWIDEANGYVGKAIGSLKELKS